MEMDGRVADDGDVQGSPRRPIWQALMSWGDVLKPFPSQDICSLPSQGAAVGAPRSGIL